MNHYLNRSPDIAGGTGSNNQSLHGGRVLAGTLAEQALAPAFAAKVSGAMQSAIPMTYAQMLAAIAASTLRVEQVYLISDYQTIHIIPNTTNVCENGVVVTETTATYLGGNFAVNGGEPLYVQAVASNKLAVQAWSAAFPQDEIDYAVSAVDIGNAKTNKGTITRRLDLGRTVETGYDWRTVKFRRWEVTGIAAQHSATVAGDQLNLAAPLAGWNSFDSRVVRLTNADVVANPVRHVTFSSSPRRIEIFNPARGGYYATGQPYLVTFWRFGYGNEYFTVLKLSDLEARVVGKYLAVSSSTPQMFASPGILYAVSSMFRDALTFSGTVGNVRFSRVAAGQELPNVVFSSICRNVDLLAPSNCTFNGAVAGLFSKAFFIGIYATGTIVNCHLLGVANNIMIASADQSTFSTKMPFFSVTSMGFANVEFYGIVQLSFFNSDSNFNRRIENTSFQSVINSIISGYYDKCQFGSTLDYSFIGESELSSTYTTSSHIASAVAYSLVSFLASNSTLTAPLISTVFRSSAQRTQHVGVVGFRDLVTQQSYEHYSLEADGAAQTLTLLPSNGTAPLVFGAGAFGMFPLSQFTVTTNGAQAIPLPAGAAGVIDLKALEIGGSAVRPLYQGDYSVTNATLTITAAANLVAGDKVGGSYYKNTVTKLPTVLIFRYSPDFGTDYNITTTAKQAGFFIGHTLVNVATVTYKKLITPVSLPFTLAVGDAFSVVITRTDPTLPSTVSITTA